MTTVIDALKRRFREGQRAEAIEECEALRASQPGNAELDRLCASMHAMTGAYARALELFRSLRVSGGGDPDLLFNIGLCERELKDFAAAAKSFAAYTQKFPAHPDGWTGLAECRFRLNEFKLGLESAERALRLDGRSIPALTVRGQCLQALGQTQAALQSYNQAIQLAPQAADVRVHRGDLYEAVGQIEQAVTDYTAALARSPADDATLKKVTTLMLHMDRGPEAIRLCEDVLKANPDSLTARLGIEWLLSQMVPYWHVPMMNEEARNRPYHDALKTAVTPEKLVLEIGTGSGLLSMMAARLGAKQVVTCEAVRLVADTARRIIERNGLQDRIAVVSKPSYSLALGGDLPEKADILVHEIFSSELLGEQVLPALEDAKARLLKPGATVLPAQASIMIALVGGDELATELHVDTAFGFDLSLFNSIYPRKRPIHREDLPRVLLSRDTEAFCFDFEARSSFPAEKKQLEIVATSAGLCFGVIQWVRFNFGHGIVFENHPSQRRPVASWQHTIYRFEAPVRLEQGAVVKINAAHDRSRPWFTRV
jgi:tetratricopeptide (TPR) repeat protein